MRQQNGSIKPVALKACEPKTDVSYVSMYSRHRSSRSAGKDYRSVEQMKGKRTNRTVRKKSSTKFSVLTKSRIEREFRCHKCGLRARAVFSEVDRACCVLDDVHEGVKNTKLKKRARNGSVVVDFWRATRVKKRRRKIRQTTQKHPLSFLFVQASPNWDLQGPPNSN